MIVNGIYDEQTDTITLDKTAGEIMAAAPNVGWKFAEDGGTEIHAFSAFYEAEGEYTFVYEAGSNMHQFSANSANDYPSMAN